jgi:hypothetical protein
LFFLLRQRQLCSGPDPKPEISARSLVSALALHFSAHHKVVDFPLDLLSLFFAERATVGSESTRLVVFVGGSS